MALQITVRKPARESDGRSGENGVTLDIIRKSCHICTNENDKLKALDPCQHRICDDCLCEIASSATKQDTDPKCPFCRQAFFSKKDMTHADIARLHRDEDTGGNALQESPNTLSSSKEKYKRLRVGKTDPFFSTPVYKSDIFFCVELTKRANDEDFKELLQVLEIWKGENCCSVWASDTLPADLNLPVGSDPPSCKIIQAFVLCRERPAILVTVYEEVQGSKIPADNMMDYTAETARALTRLLHRYCHCDFLILPCVLSQAELNIETLSEQIKLQQEFSRCYFRGPETLTADAFYKLRKSTRTLSSLSFVPCFFPADSSSVGDEEWLYVLDPDMRRTLSLVIETLTRGHVATESIEYTSQTEKKLKVAAIEAARRVSFQREVEIVTGEAPVEECFRKLKDQTKREFEGSVAMKLKTQYHPVSGPSTHPKKGVVESLPAPALESTSDPKKRVVESLTTPALESTSKEDPRYSTDCSFCRKDLPVRATTVVEFTELTTRRDSRLKMVLQFMKAINACFNVGEGCVIVHMDNPYFFGHFHELVDAKLMQILPDDSTYHENFESFALDEHHVVVRVTARQRSSLSTLNFHTKLSFDAGLCDPTHVQMRRLLAVYEQHEKQKTKPRSSRLHQLVNFTQGKEVTVPSGVFQEGLSLQTKRIARGVHDIDRKLNCDDLLRCMLGQCYLKNYICAFSKIPEGGSVYFGIQEEMVRTERRIPLRKFVCEGCSIDSEEMYHLTAKIQEKVANEMLWLGSSPPKNPVEVIFHHVEDAEPDRWVVEIVVKYFHGISFHDSEGPEAYTYRMVNGGWEVQRIGLDEWLRGNESSLKPQEPVFSNYMFTRGAFPFRFPPGHPLVLFSRAARASSP